MTATTVLSIWLASSPDPLMQAGPGNVVPWWVWAILIILALFVVGEIVYWLAFGRRKPSDEAAKSPGASGSHVAATARQTAASAAAQTGERVAASVVPVKEKPPLAAPVPATEPVPPSAPAVAERFEPAVSAAEPDPMPAAKSAQATAPTDNLKVVEGIGPKMAALLNSAGITTYAQLATADVESLRQLVRGAGYAMADPATWPEQARFAAEGNWDGLKELQGQLRGGRRDRPATG